VLDVRPVAEIVHNSLVAYSQECSQLEINDEITVLVISCFTTIFKPLFLCMQCPTVLSFVREIYLHTFLLLFLVVFNF